MMMTEERDKLEKAHSLLQDTQRALADAVVANHQGSFEDSRRPEIMKIAIALFDLTEKVWAMFEASRDEVDSMDADIKNYRS